MWMILNKKDTEYLSEYTPVSENVDTSVVEIRKIGQTRYKIERNTDGSVKAAYRWTGEPYSPYLNIAGVGYTSKK